jgi:hypothetical protein
MAEMRNDFDRSNTGILGSNPVQGVDACLRLSHMNSYR